MRVLMFDIDTLRADHMGCYGYGRNTTPNMDRVAEEGVRFDRYYCPNAPCLPSRASLVSGQYGIHNGVVGHGGTAADMRLQGATRGFTDDMSENGLFMQFRRAGFHTVSFSTFAERHSAWWFNSGFNECINVGGRGVESAEMITPHVLDWIERNGEKDNWMLHVHYWDPHTPYRTRKIMKIPSMERRFVTTGLQRRYFRNICFISDPMGRMKSVCGRMFPIRNTPNILEASGQKRKQIISSICMTMVSAIQTIRLA